MSKYTIFYWFSLILLKLLSYFITPQMRLVGTLFSVYYFSPIILLIAAIMRSCLAVGPF